MAYHGSEINNQAIFSINQNIPYQFLNQSVIKVSCLVVMVSATQGYYLICLLMSYI